MARLPGIASVGRVDPGVARSPAIAAPRDTSGQGLEVLGNAASAEIEKLSAVEQRLTAKQEVIGRSRAKTKFNELANAELRRIETEEDVTDARTLDTFGKFLTQAQETAASEHTGSGISKAQLGVALDDIRSTVALKAGQMSATQSRALLSDERQEMNNRMAALVQQDPTKVLEAFDVVGAMVAEQGPALTPDEERDAIATGRAHIVVSAVGNILDRDPVGGADAVEAMLAIPGVAGVLTPEQSRRINSRIIKARALQDKGKREGQQTLERVAAILGVGVDDLSPAIRARAAGVSPPQGRQTLAEKIAEFEAVAGPASPEQVEKLAGVHIAEGGDDPFGKGLAGRSIARVSDDAPAFAAGLLGEEDDRRFIAAVVELQQPITFSNPDTGLLETRRRALPPFVKEALTRRGMEGLIETVQTTETPPVPVETTGVEGPTIFGEAAALTGPVATAFNFFGRVPVLGEAIDASQFTQAQSRVGLLARDLVRVLQNNPKFSEGERQAIAKDIDISPSLIDTPKAFRNRLIGIDDALIIRQRNAAETAFSPHVSLVERRRAMDILNAIGKFREQLGAPPLMKTPEEARELPPGTIFRTPDGSIRRVPE